MKNKKRPEMTKQMMEHYVIKSRADSADLAKAAAVVEQVAWKELGFLNFTRSQAQYEALLEYHADYQLCLVNVETGYVMAASNSVPFYLEDQDRLDPRGWDWVVEQAYETRQMKPNMMAGLAVSVPNIHKSQGLARIMIGAMKALAVSRGLAGPVIPVRPSLKNRHPDVPIADYMRWQDDQGRPYDPWLRSHINMGGHIVGPCEQSMVVEEPIGFWEAWTNRHYTQSGAFEVPGGLVPVQIDRASGVGRYAEPNVWFRY
jgi:hypothetical protein